MAEPAPKRPRTAGPEDDEDSEEELPQEEDSDDDDSDDDDEAGDQQVTLTFGDDDASAAVIWMHGLGDTPTGWAAQANKIRMKAMHTKWVLPCAPEHPVTCNDGEICTSWMDLLEIPITSRTKDNGRDLPESITIIHKLIDDLIGEGMPANRIVLGGFSQGAALALAASLQYPKQLAGVCMLSGWCLRNLDVPSLVASSANKNTPFLVCHGDADTTVFPACSRLVTKALQDAGPPVEFHSYKEMAHGSCKEELDHVLAFIKRVVP